MNKTNALTPIETQLKAVLDVPAADPAFVQNLRTTLLNVPGHSQAPINQISWRWVMAAVLFLALLISFFVLGPDQVLAKLQNMLGKFIPGIGFVNSDYELRVLDKRVQQVNPGGAAIQVVKGIADAQKTRIQVEFTGKDSRKCNSHPDAKEEDLGGQVLHGYLLLPDGQKLDLDRPLNQSWSGLAQFPALPVGVNQATLVLPSNLYYACTPGDTLPGKCVCQDDALSWKVQLKFVVPAPGAVLPVIDSSTSTPPVALVPTQPAAASPTATIPAEPEPELVGKLVHLPDGYLILAAIKPIQNASTQNPAYGAGVQSFLSFGMDKQPARLTDASGAEIPIEELDRSEVNAAVFDDFNWPGVILYRAKIRQINGPLTLTFPTIVNHISGTTPAGFGKEAVFQVNFDKESKTAKMIPIHRTFNFIPGYPFTIKQIEMENTDGNQVDVKVYFEKDLENVILQEEIIQGDVGTGGINGGCVSDQTSPCIYHEFTMKMNPEGLYTFHIYEADVYRNGPLVLTFPGSK
jgi:hypothetical protein